MKNRVEWVDTARGIGILFVIMGHTGLPIIFRSWIYSFHMPLFFIISGLLFRPLLENKVLIKKQFKALLVPYIIYSAIFIACDFIIFRDIDEVISNLYKTVIGRGGYSVLWFLVPLFFVGVTFNYLVNIFKAKKLTMVTVICAAIGYVITLFTQINPYGIITSSVALLFFYIGYYVKTESLLQKWFRKDYRIIVILLGTIQLIVFVINYKLCGRYVDLSDGYFAVLPLTIITAVLGTYVVSYFSNLLDSFVFLKPIKYIGRNTIFFFPLTAYLPKRITTIIESQNGIVMGFLGKILIIILSFFIIAILIELINKVKFYRQKNRDLYINA